MATTTAIAALGAVEWEGRLLAMLAHPMSGTVVTRRCVDGVDVRSALRSHHADLVLVTDATLRVDATLVADAHDSGAVLVALSSDRDRWLALGADHVVPVDADDVAVAVGAIVGLQRDATAAARRRSIPAGTMVVIGGFGGGGGRSTCLRELGLALGGTSAGDVLLVDADTYGPSLAQELSLGDTPRGILSACRAVEAGELRAGPSARSELEPHIVPVMGKLAAMPGLARASRWADLRPSALRTLWEACTVGVGLTVVGIGPLWEGGRRLPGDHSQPHRAAAAATALEASSTVVLCARADSVGIARLVSGLMDAGDLLDDKRVAVVLSAVQSKAHGRDASHAVTRHSGVTDVYCVPAAPAALHLADQQGCFASRYDRGLAAAYESIGRALVPDGRGTASLSLRAVDDYLSAGAA